jgi:predicted component of type VI protein secretion system
MSNLIMEEIKATIRETIEVYEPRARVIDVIVQTNEVRQAYDVYIYFEVINSVEPVTLNITLYRAR